MGRSRRHLKASHPPLAFQGPARQKPTYMIVLDGVWLVLDRPGGDVVTTQPTQVDATGWVQTHHPKADIHLAHGVGENKWKKVDQERLRPTPNLPGQGRGTGFGLLAI